MGTSSPTAAHAPSPGDAASDFAGRLRAALADTGPLPLPGQGSTLERFARLTAVAEEDLAIARLVEGDADARAILAESGRGEADPGVTYGVWAARSPAAVLRAPPPPREVGCSEGRRRSARAAG